MRRYIIQQDECSEEEPARQHAIILLKRTDPLSKIARDQEMAWQSFSID